MSKTQKRNEALEEKIVKENIQKRFKSMFTGKGEPLSNMSIQEVESLKARIIELEASLALKPKSEPGESFEEENSHLQFPSLPTLSRADSNTEETIKGKHSFWTTFTVPATQLSARIIFSTLLIFSVVLIGFLVYSYLTAQADNQARALDLSLQAEGSFNSKIRNLGDFALGLAVEAANNPEIQIAFAERDRQKLTELTLPGYLVLDKQFGIPQYQYHLPPAMSFLRLHSLERYGDDLSSFRATVVQVNETRQPVSGLEVGRGGLGLRGVVPVFFENKHIGSVEYGLNIDEGLVNNLKQEYGNDWRIILTRDALALATLEDISALQEGPTPDLLVLASTVDAAFPDPNSYSEALNGQRQISTVTDDQKHSYSITSLPLKDYSGKTVGIVDIIIDQTALIQAQRSRLLLIFLVGGFVFVLGAYSLATIANRALKPLGALTKAAQAVQQGDLTNQIQVSGRDEIGQLGRTFNAMTAQLRDLIEGLEQRVEERTHDIELASDVSRAVSEKISDQDILLKEAVNLIHDRFDLYHTQLYLTDLSGSTLFLRAGTGEVGEELLHRQHQLPVNHGSLNGRAAAEKQTVLVANTNQDPSFLPNPLLPETRSEMAVPLIANGVVLGVLDMQSAQPGALNELNLPIFETLAGQLAIAIQNAALLAQAKEARTEVEAQIRHLTEQGWQDFLDAIERGQKIGFAFSQSQIVRLQPDSLAAPDRSFIIPLMVTGAKIGEIHVPIQQERVWSNNELELIKATGAQLAQHIDNLRLLAQAERYRTEAEQAIRRLTRDGWENYQQLRGDEAPGYMFNLVNVQPLTANGNRHVSAAIQQPLLIRGETIGELTVDGPDHQAEAVEIITAVAEQLSQHVENLRLAEEMEKRSSELATMAGQLSEALDIARLANWEYDVARDRFIFNDHFYSIFHTTAEEVGGYEISSAEYAERFVHPEDRPMVGQEIGKALSSADRHYNVHLEHRILFADGGVGYISVDVHIERDEQGNIIRYYGANQDITERKKAEEILRVSEARLSEALDIAKLANWEYDLERDKFIFNDHFYSIFRTTAEQVGGYELSSAEYSQLFVHPDDAALVGIEIGKAVASTDRHFTAKVEHRCLFGDGNVGYMSVAVNIERDENGKIIRWYGANQDITERQQAEQIIAQRATQLATVANLSSTTSTLLDPDKLLQTVVDLTKERFRLYHAHIYLADESWNTLLLAAGAGEVGRQMVADGWNISMDHDQSIVASAARNRVSVIANDVVRDMSSTFLSNQLLPDTRSEMAVPMIVGQKLLGVFDVQADTAGYFTEEDANVYTTLAAQVAVALQNARLYVEQAATLTQLRELDKLKSSFLANMSHELRTPLNSILGFTDVMLEELDGPLTEHMDNDLRLIQKNGQHLLHLINDVLDMAKIEAGRMNLNPENFKAFEVMEEVTSITSTLASEKNLALFIDETSERDLEIYADRTRLRQVMINLVNNAIKFTEEGNISLKVASMPGARVLITVKDTGIGIAPDKLEAIFQEFTQVDSSSTRKAGGTGLGLPISRRLVEMHGGHLWAESTGIPGEGSTFFVELPIEARISEVVEKQAV